MKTIKNILVVISAGALLVGCSTYDHHNSGGMGNDSEMGSGSGEVRPTQLPPTGANGSISPSNPFGAGSGTGLTPAN